MMKLGWVSCSYEDLSRFLRTDRFGLCFWWFLRELGRRRSDDVLSWLFFDIKQNRAKCNKCT